MGVDIGIIITIGLAFVSVLLTINLFVLKEIGKRIDTCDIHRDKKSDEMCEIVNRLTILETKFNGYEKKNK